jgi:hypothetical protein
MGVSMKNKKVWTIDTIIESSTNKAKYSTGLYANGVLIAIYDSKTNASVDCDKLNGNWAKNRI